MKKLLVIIACAVCSMSIMAQGPASASGRSKKKEVYQYCAKIKDGLLVMTKDDKEMTTDEMLLNGTKIRTDGTVIRGDGTVTILEDGQCVDQMGNVFPSKNKNKPKRQDENRKETDFDPIEN